MAGSTQKNAINRIVGKLVHLPGTLFQLMKDKVGSLIYSAKMADTAADTLDISSAAIAALELGLKQRLQQPSISSSPLNHEDKGLIAKIQELTQRENRNNITRTKAYWIVFVEHPELHWALLAHLVSRNGGWNMTDLKGDLIPRLVSSKQAEHHFHFLERANGLIFQDAYPQLLLYIESKRRNRSMFHLLPKLHISMFMEPVWQHFWQNRSSALLTVCLIINEQNYIEKRIIQNPKYRETVLDTLKFKVQSLLQLNQVVFPYGQKDVDLTIPTPSYRLAGLILEDFGNLKERIEFGKKLYAILFGLPAVYDGAVAFAAHVPHTGSRADYLPELYAPIRKAPPELVFKERLMDGCKLKEGAMPFYSPTLAGAWADRELEPAEPGDWFVNLKAMQHIRPIPVPFLFDMTSEACFGLNKIELAILAGQTMKL